LGVPGNARGGGVLVRDLVIALEQRQRKKYGRLDAKDFSPAAAEKMSSWLAEEVAFEAGKRDSGFGWYGKKYQKALNNISEVFPQDEARVEHGRPS
jgi:hypothetical protein